MPNPKDRPLSDPSDILNPSMIRIRFTGDRVHETILENLNVPLPQAGDWIKLPDGSGRYGVVDYRIYDFDGQSLTVTVMLKT
jgi:hypothetical protein